MSAEAQAVLTSGGLDSAILLAHQAQAGTNHRESVRPIYVRSGLNWEPVELNFLLRYLKELRPRFPNVGELVILDQPTADLYGSHWSVTTAPVPDALTPDEAVYLPGRNLLLTIKALVWCHLNGAKSLALGVLASNPFPDASPDFFASLTRTVGLAFADHQLRVITPFGSLHKTEVMHLGRGLPLEWSFSCIDPRGKTHCGHCNKCAERQKAFRDAGLADPTVYAI